MQNEKYFKMDKNGKEVKCKFLEEDCKFKVMTEEGKDVECEGLLLIECDENRNYLVFTDYSKDEENNMKLYANIINPNDEKSVLYPVESEEEWQFIEKVIEKARVILKKIEKENV